MGHSRSSRESLPWRANYVRQGWPRDASPILHSSFHRRKETAEAFSAKVCKELGYEFRAVVVPNNREVTS